MRMCMMKTQHMMNMMMKWRDMMMKWHDMMMKWRDVMMKWHGMMMKWHDKPPHMTDIAMCVRGSVTAMTVRMPSR